jgi:hypothetical protein
VAGVLDDRWAAWFDGLLISGQGEETVICGLVADQPALHGLLTKVRDLGLCLISVRRWSPARTTSRTTTPASATATKPATSALRRADSRLAATHPAAQPPSATTPRPGQNSRPDKRYPQIWRKT